MPLFELRYRPAALADLEDIFRSVLRLSASPITARRYITLSRHVLAELGALDLPRLQIVISEAVASGEISLSGVLPKDGAAAEEIAALLAELRAAGGLPT